MSLVITIRAKDIKNFDGSAKEFANNWSCSIAKCARSLFPGKHPYENMNKIGFFNDPDNPEEIGDWFIHEPYGFARFKSDVKKAKLCTDPETIISQIELTAL